MGKPSKDYAVPLWEKANLTVYEAAAYSGIGADKLRELSDREDCEFVLWNGTKRLIKRKKLDLTTPMQAVRRFAVPCKGRE